MNTVTVAVARGFLAVTIIVGIGLFSTGCGSQGAASPVSPTRPPSSQPTQQPAFTQAVPTLTTPPRSTQQPAVPSLQPSSTPPTLPAPTPAPQPTQQPTSQPTQKAPSGLAGTIWIWDRFVDSGEKGSFAVPFPPAYRLEFLPDGKYSILADCNRGSGAYVLEGSSLTLNPGPLTRAECRPGSRSSDFVRMLGQVATFVLKGEALYLNLKMDSGDMVFGKLYSVTGRITGPAGAVVPAGSTTEAMIVDGAGKQIGGSIVQAQLPMDFEAPFKPANIDPLGTYTLEVTIKDAQKTAIFRGSRSYPVLTQGNPTYHLEVQVEAVR